MGNLRLTSHPYHGAAHRGFSSTLRRLAARSLSAVSSLVTMLPARALRQDGQTLAEYGILLGVIAVVVVAVAVLLGSNISTLFSSISKHL